MLGLWQQDIEWLEAISQDEDARALFLRMAALSQEGRLEPFLTELARDDELDEHTKGTVAELAGDTAFLLAVADYLASDRSRSLRSPAPAGDTSRFPQTPSPVARVARGLGARWGHLPVSPDPFHGPLRGHHCVMGDRGFEPRTSALSERRSNQLS